MKSNYKNTVWGFTRFLGMKQTSPCLKEETKYLTAKCVNQGNHGVGFELHYRGEPQVFSPEQLTAMFLEKLKKIYEKSGIYCKDVVISVPPYFSSVERQAMLDAAKIANINCLKLINETTAIGLCYGLFRHSEFGEKPRNVVFLDLGYSKFTVSVMSFKSTQFQIIAQGWDAQLGARTMDSTVMDKIIDDFKVRYKRDLRDNPKAIVRLSDAVARVRKLLSANVEAPVSVESIMDDHDVYYNIKRKEFEVIIAPILERITSICQAVVAESGLKKEDIHSIEMVGEATRIPIVVEKVKECIGAPTARTMNSADCVARGCAIQCAVFSPLFRVKEYGIVDYNPFPVDIAYNQPKSADGTELKKVRTLFERGCNFPVTKAMSFENRKEALEMQLMYNHTLGALPLGGPTLLGNYKINPGTPLESKFTLSVKISLDHNMITYVSAAETVEDYVEEKKVVVKRDAPTPPPPAPEKKEEKPAKMEDVKEEKKEAKPEDKKEEHKTEEKKAEEKKEGEKMTDVPHSQTAPIPPPPQQEYEIQKIPKKRKTPIDFQYEVHGLSSKDIADFVEVEKKMDHEDLLIISTKERKNALESYIYEMRSKIGNEMRDYSDAATAKKVIEYAQKAEDWLFGEGREQAKDAYEAKIKELESVFVPVKSRYKAYERLSDMNIMLASVCQKTAAIGKELFSKHDHYTREDRDGLNKLITEQIVWSQASIGVLKGCPRTLDPPVKNTEYEDRIHKLEEV